jgi:glutathione S-transferase
LARAARATEVERRFWVSPFDYRTAAPAVILDNGARAAQIKGVGSMKLYNHPMAPNPRRVRIFAAEKAIQLQKEDIDLLSRQNRTPQFLAKNPSGGLPVLELDDGTCVSESVAICRYLEGLRPEPSLFGRNLREQVEIEMWNRRMELELFATVGSVVRNTNELFRGIFPQFPDYGNAQRAVVEQRLERMDRELEGREFIAGERFTIADITALVAIDIAAMMANIRPGPQSKNLARWHQAVSSRPSASA